MFYFIRYIAIIGLIAAINLITYVSNNSPGIFKSLAVGADNIYYLCMKYVIYLYISLYMCLCVDMCVYVYRCVDMCIYVCVCLFV